MARSRSLVANQRVVKMIDFNISVDSGIIAIGFGSITIAIRGLRLQQDS